MKDETNSSNPADLLAPLSQAPVDVHFPPPAAHTAAREAELRPVRSKLDRKDDRCYCDLCPLIHKRGRSYQNAGAHFNPPMPRVKVKAITDLHQEEMRKLLERERRQMKTAVCPRCKNKDQLYEEERQVLVLVGDEKPKPRRYLKRCPACGDRKEMPRSYA